MARRLNKRSVGVIDLAFNDLYVASELPMFAVAGRRTYAALIWAGWARS
jgi:hypothetical protein